ncbi:hypothetical protein ITJ66_07625 [Plantibacter sp. VKM Ac-2885]|uniref:hypothetical protein n=1 Tax=Plantibacter TaxID=190323 RepID=UPI0010C19996|nr:MULTISPECIES: hypothetical protein [Plantibacter]MBD8516226.1 hypothetical protein [Plantibacter sp. CFBP 8804]MBD8536012.1 hypothetical protein [Plantibacter sp. CFBP 13570]MBF4512356.1 hypothetical protein [Plantibacter sp. VKM Ac-2885]MDD9152368.1 hypothetical protein [Plantibacter flavus]
MTMGVWRKSRRKPMKPYVAPPEVAPPPVEHAVEEGLLIARSWTVVEVTNWIIERALRDGASYDAEATQAAVRRELGRMADEQEEYADLAREARQTAFQRRGSARHQHDYRAGDLSALSRRREVYSGLAAELRRVSKDEEFVAAIAESARERAWGDLERAIQAKLDRVLDEPVVDEHYRRARSQRLRWFRDLDLAALIAANPKDGSMPVDDGPNPYED